ncbi:MAG: tetratricopeptide repeat protein [Calditrichaeota bacterium]|nr:tetratricopeptide repeat protein [Calditrichota bacterium]
MANYEITLIAMDVRKWDLETQKLALTSYYVIDNEEKSSYFEISILQPPEMVEEFLGKLRYSCEQALRKQEGDDGIEVEFESETFLRQKLYNYFKRILMELNNPRRRKGQPKMIFSTHMDVYNENQDISFLPREIQFFVVLNWVRKYYEKEDYQKAIEPLRKLIKIKPDFGLGYKWLARSLKKIRKYDEAMRFYEKYAEVDGSLDSLLDLAKSYRKGKIFDKSEQIYHEILEKYPGEKEARIGLAQIKYARKEPDYLQILDELYQEDPEWLKEWLVEEFNFRIYVPEKTLLSPVQAARFLGYERVLDLTQKAFKNEVPSHFNPTKARLSFYKEELENWAMVMNRFQCFEEEIKLYPDQLTDLPQPGAAEVEEEESEAAAGEEKMEAEPGTPGGRPLTRVEEILLKIRAQKALRGYPAGTTGQMPSPEEGEAAPKKRRGRPRKTEVEATEPEAEAEAMEAPAAEPVKRKRGRPRKSEAAAAEAAETPETEQPEETPKRRRGRPRKTETTEAAAAEGSEQAVEGEEKPARKRGRPRKSETAAESTETPAEAAEAPKRKRGRPRKTEVEASDTATGSADTESSEAEPPRPRKRGRPPKNKEASVAAETTSDQAAEETPKPKRRGRPPKKAAEQADNNGQANGEAVAPENPEEVKPPVVEENENPMSGV